MAQFAYSFVLNPGRPDSYRDSQHDNRVAPLPVRTSLLDSTIAQPTDVGMAILGGMGGSGGVFALSATSLMNCRRPVTVPSASHTVFCNNLGITT